MHKTHGLMSQKDLKEIVSAINFFFFFLIRLCLTTSVLGDVKNVRYKGCSSSFKCDIMLLTPSYDSL